MKNSKILLPVLLALCVTFGATAQYDDLYYNPDNDTDTYYEEESGDTYVTNNYYGDDYDEYDDAKGSNRSDDYQDYRGRPENRKPINFNDYE